MVFKINFQARLKRHNRIKKAFGKSKFLSYFGKFKLISIILAIVLPIYPSIGVFALNRESKVGKYDETSIITAYSYDEDIHSIISTDSGFLKAQGIQSSARDTTGNTQLVYYVVRSGDTLSGLAEKFNVSQQSIAWANNLDAQEVLSSGTSLRIPPVSGVIYTVLAGDTLDSISQKFKIPSESIKKQNLLASDAIEKGAQLVIPGARKIDIPREVKIAQAKPKDSKISNKKTPDTKILAKGGSQGKGKKYSVKYTGNARGFYWGNCTYYVAQHKNVTWRGNANAWLRNAAAQGVATGKTPAIGSIISFGGSGYNPYYGHVGIVADIDENDIIVKDMNYRKLGEVTIRRISKGDKAIRGYIYID